MSADSRGNDDRFIPLGFAVEATPGAYAVLAGAGISRGAGVPTAWQVVTELVRQVCAVRYDEEAAAALDESTVEGWWLTEFGRALGYSELLAELGITPTEREAKLRSFFDPAGGKRPTSAAHDAVARLVAGKFIRVIVTMNFDHLFEQALESHGVVPTVVRTEADAAGVAPLHTLECLVVHLHGDYKNAASMRNTVEELREYGPAMSDLLAKILTDRAIIAVGWSSEYDPALRAAVAENVCRHHTSAWIDPNPSDSGRELAQLMSAQVFEAGADDALTRVADIVETLDSRAAARHPLTVAVASDRVKKDLTGQRPAITAHDVFMTEYARATSALSRYASEDQVDLPEAAREIADSSEVLCAAAAALAYWGDPQTDDWWSTAVLEHAQRWRGGASIQVSELPLALSTRILYAAGVAATAARRYDVLGALFSTEVLHTRSGQATAVSAALPWSRSVAGQTPLTNELREQLARVVGDSLVLLPQRVDAAWEEFEVLRLAHQIGTYISDSSERIAEVESKREAVESLKRLNIGGAEFVKAAQELDKAEMALGSLAAVAGSHVRLHKEQIDTWGQRRYVADAIRRVQRSSAPAAMLRWSPSFSVLEEVDAALTGLGTAISAAAYEQQKTEDPAWLDDAATDN
ncbi:SIR2 family protein [Gordonia sp. (in: high G+C Gram-positive bacteria)]|uniref:SIR2 family protein n=1 Tax=Gordonia sp. (in: high G+C Gram-positive bacteria) TaxID=84139 RepID=UPI003C768EBB